MRFIALLAVLVWSVDVSAETPAAPRLRVLLVQATCHAGLAEASGLAADRS